MIHHPRPVKGLNSTVVNLCMEGHLLSLYSPFKELFYVKISTQNKKKKQSLFNKYMLKCIEQGISFRSTWLMVGE